MTWLNTFFQIKLLCVMETHRFHLTLLGFQSSFLKQSLPPQWAGMMLPRWGLYLAWRPLWWGSFCVLGTLAGSFCLRERLEASSELVRVKCTQALGFSQSGCAPDGMRGSVTDPGEGLLEIGGEAFTLSLSTEECISSHWYLSVLYKGASDLEIRPRKGSYCCCS